ncbi:hypothetical protein BC827DRAFT_1240425, partial [Russula dissimulans]
MVDFNTPVMDSRDHRVLTKLWHAMAGLYIWEFVTTFEFEWNVIRRRHPYHWPVLVYSVTRVATLLNVILNIVDLDASIQYNHCQVLITFQFIFGYLALAAASLLIVLRTIAIWKKTFFIVAFTTFVWLTYLSFLVYGISQSRSARGQAEGHCMLRNVEASKFDAVVTLATDIVLIFVMLIGLFRMRQIGGGWFELGSLLWKQGVVWLLLSTAAVLPPVVLICLNLNAPLDFLFQFPALIILSIAATRMHSSLANFVSESPHEYRTRSARTPLCVSPVSIAARVEVTVKGASEESPMSETNQMEV